MSEFTCTTSTTPNFCTTPTNTSQNTNSKPPSSETRTLKKGQNIVLGYTIDLGNGSATDNWSLENNVETLKNNNETKAGLFAGNRSKYTEVTYNAKNNEANEVTLGLTRIDKDTTTRIDLDSQDILRVPGKKTKIDDPIQFNQDGTVTVTFKEVSDNINYNKNDKTDLAYKWKSATHTTIVTMPKDSVESITKNFSADLKAQLKAKMASSGTNTSTPNTTVATATTGTTSANTSSTETPTTASKKPYFNSNDKNQDDFMTVHGGINTQKVFNLDDTDVEGSPEGKDQRQGLQIETLDPNATDEHKAYINLGKNDYIDKIEDASLENVDKYGKDTTRITLKQKNDNGGSRTITITLPTASVEKAVEKLPKELQEKMIANKNKLWGSKMVTQSSANKTAEVPSTETPTPNTKKPPLW